MTPRGPSVDGSVRAKRRNVSAWLPFVIHCFEPVIRQPSPSATAVVRSEPASEPASGSVSANAPIASPRASGGTNRVVLLVGAERDDRQRGGARVHGDGDADACVGARELLEHEDVGEEVGACASELLGHADAHQAELAELRVELDREPVLAIPRGCVRRDLGVRELARERLDLALSLGRSKSTASTGVRGRATARLSTVLVEAAAGLAAEPSGGDVLAQQRARRVLGVRRAPRGARP